MATRLDVNAVGNARQQRRYRLWLTMLCVAMLAACGAPVYVSDPIRARVVDAETGEPIAGAVVTANWQLQMAGFHEYSLAGQLEIKETVTDRDGYFHFDGFTKLGTIFAELRNQDPKILIFKPGYAHAKYVNRQGVRGIHHHSQVVGETIKLKKISITKSEGSVLYLGLGTEAKAWWSDCDWKKTPRMILAMDDERRRIKRTVAPLELTDLANIDNMEQLYSGRCGPVRKFLEKYR